MQKLYAIYAELFRNFKGIPFVRKWTGVYPPSTFKRYCLGINKKISKKKEKKGWTLSII